MKLQNSLGFSLLFVFSNSHQAVDPSPPRSPWHAFQQLLQSLICFSQGIGFIGQDLPQG